MPSRCTSHWTWVLQLTWRVRNCLSLRLCECKYCISNLSNVHLWAPNPNNTVPNSFGISNKVCYLPSPFLQNYCRAWIATTLVAIFTWFYPAIFQQYFSSISVAWLKLVIMRNLKLRNVPFHLILNHVYGLIFNQAAMQLSSSPTQ